MTTAAVLTTVAILLGCFASSHAVRVPIVKLGDNPLETLAQEIIACQCISEKIIGTGNADSLELALHTRNLTLSFVHTSVTNDNSLQVDANLDIWSHRVYMTAFLTYDNSQLNLQLGFNTTFNLTTLYELILPGDKVPSFMWDISKFASEASVELSTAPLNGRAAGVSVEAGITLTPGSYLFEIATVLGEIDNNGQIAGSLFFPFPASSKKHGMRGGSFTLLDFSFHIDGTWHLGKNIVANGLNFTIDIGNPTTVSVGSVLSINMFRSTTQWNGQTSFTYGTSIAAFTFTCTLAQQWANTFGMKWINVETATVTLTISDQMQPNSIQISGTTQLGFSKTTAQFTGSITDYIDILFVLEDIPVASLAQIVSTTTNSNPDVINGLSATSTATIALSTFSGQYQEGLTLSADIVCSSGTMLGVQKQVTNQPLNWVLTLYIPIFSESPEDIQFTMTETNPIQMTSNTQITTLTFQVSVNYEVSINIDADWAMVFTGNGGQTVTFTTTANYVTGQNLQFQGQLTSPWNDPFGGKWLTIDSASATIVIGEAVAHSLDISAEVTVSFNSKSSAQTTAELQTGSSFDEVTFSLTIQEDWTVSEIGSGVAGISSPMLGGVVTNEATFEFIICNYQGGMAQEGLTLITNGQITKPITGLFSMIAPGQTGQVTWQVSLYIPIFGNPAQWVLSLNFNDEIQINAHWWFESLNLNINNQANTASLSSVLRADLHNNPNIMFTVGGKVESDGELVLYGEEQGTWTNVFGITGLTITNAYTQLGLDSSMCSVDGCISQVGIGFTTQVGTKTIIFAGNAAAPNFGACFMMGSISDSNGVVLTVRDIARQWNVMVPGHQINVNSIPPSWGLQSAMLSMASDAGTFGQYTYEQGLHFKGTLLILQQTYTVDIDCGMSGLAPSCDFNLNVQVDFNQFLDMLKKEVGADKEAKWNIFSLKSVSLGDWKTSNLAQLVDPAWAIDIEVFGKNHNLNFRTPTQTLAGSFHNFYEQYLKHLFH